MKAIRRALTMSMLAGMTLCALGAVSGLGERDLALLRGLRERQDRRGALVAGIRRQRQRCHEQWRHALLVPPAPEWPRRHGPACCWRPAPTSTPPLIDGATPLFHGRPGKTKSTPPRTLLEAGANVNAAKTKWRHAAVYRF